MGGSLGTLSEIAFALKLRRPVVTLGSWHLDPEQLPDHARLLAAETPAEAVSLLFHHIRA